MPRWNNSLEDNCKHILDKVITNLRTDMHQILLLDLVTSDLENNKKIIESYVRSKLGATSTLSKKTKQYWIIRGWSDTESYVKSKENKQKNAKSVYSRDFWLERINPTTGNNYNPEEADFERNSRRPIRKEYWIQKGYNEVDALKLADDTKKQNNKKGSQKGVQNNIRRATSKRCIEYFTSRGSTIEEAKSLVSENQKYFSKDICIQKYGEEVGISIWQARQDKWQKTLSSKTNEEKSRINRLKTSKGISVSKNEKYILNEIKYILPEVSHQFTLVKSNKKQYIYDIAYENKIIEYNGDFWHSNPSNYSPEYINPRTKIKAVDKWNIDQQKLQYARDHGYKVLVIWESDFKQNKEMVIKECIQFLTQ
jgi:G:T-mismatch repair DNA endonuclease (very short patch repair protein)